MADTKTSALTELAGTAVVAGDWLPVVDTSTSTTKKLDASEIFDAPVIADSGSLITATSVNGALAEIFNGSAAVNTVATSGATETLTLAPVHKVTMDQNCEFTFPTPTAAAHTFVLYLAGSFTPTFPASVDWASAAAPTYATPSIYVFHTNDTGTTWFGALFGGAGGFG